jgi:hypothetical protein
MVTGTEVGTEGKCRKADFSSKTGIFFSLLGHNLTIKRKRDDFLDR